MDSSEIFSQLNKEVSKKNEIGMYSALTLAYIGDAVFEMCVRTKIIEQGNAPVNTLHKKSRSYVNAASQSKMYYELLKFLNEEETQIIKRGRNAKSFTKAKNASVSDYRHATGVEALFGFLFISGKTDRINELFQVCMNTKIKWICTRQCLKTLIWRLQHKISV